MQKHRADSFFRSGGGFLGFCILLAIVIAVNVIVGRLRWRADLTEEKLYTLSEGSRAVLNKIDGNVVLKFFSNADDPGMPVYLKNFSRQIEDLLNEYRLASNGRIILEIYHPKPDSDEEEWAQRFGITGQPMDAYGSLLYLGLVAVAGDAEAVIPVFDPRTESLIEYNMTRLIHRVAHPEKPVVAVLSSLPVMGARAMPYAMPGQPPSSEEAPWLAFQELSADYDWRELRDPVVEIEPDVDMLILVHPKHVSEKTLFAIDQFVLRGGRLLTFLDPMCLAELEKGGPMSPFGGPSAASDLPTLLAAWGVGYEADQVLADISASSRVRSGMNRIEESPVWLSLDSRHVNPTDVLTSQLETLLVPMGGAFADHTSETLDFTPLIFSSLSAGLVPTMTAQMGGSALRGAIPSGSAALPFAVRLSGEFKTAFPEGRPAEASADTPPETDTEVQPAAKETLQTGKSTVILVADVDMLYDRFCVEALNVFGAMALRPLNDNLNFLANTVEQLAGSADLIGIRSRGTFNRPFDRVVELQKQAMDAWQKQEQALEQNLKETQARLRDLESGKDQNQRFILSPEQEDAVAAYRRQEIEIKQKLKGVRKNLRHDIEQLGVTVKIINIALMPLLVGFAGAAYGWRRRSKR